MQDIKKLVFTYATEPIYKFPDWVDPAKYEYLLQYMGWNPRASRLIKQLDVAQRYGYTKPTKQNIFVYDYPDDYVKGSIYSQDHVREMINKEWVSLRAFINHPIGVDMISLIEKSHRTNNYEYDAHSIAAVQLYKLLGMEKPNTVYVGVLATHNEYFLIDKYKNRFANKIIEKLDVPMGQIED